MERKRLKNILDNDREWRKFIVDEITELRRDVKHLHGDVSSLKVWSWITRSAFVSAMGAVIYFIKDRLGGHNNG
jgi:hypothetical protein